MRLVESSTTSLAKKTPKCLTGEFAIFDEVNQNGRVYPRKIYEAALREIMPRVKSRSFTGECDHPIDYDEVRLSNVSHVVTELKVVGNTVQGTVELLDTPSGRVVQSLVEAGVPIGISSRAVGDYTERDGKEIINEMSLIAYDLVADPSFKSSVLSEVAKSKLGESLSLIEKRLPLCESKATSPIRTLIKGIRESLLTDSCVGVSDIELARMEVESLKKILASKQAEIAKLRSGNAVLAESVRQQSSDLKALRVQCREQKSSLTNFTRNMTKLQDAYNLLTETTVSRKDHDKLLAETVELRKKLAVESRGMTYSQVRSILEGATTSEDIESRLETLRTRRTTGKGVISELQTVAKSTKVTEGTARSTNFRLSELVSRV